jgi:hypothetical protein
MIPRSATPADETTVAARCHHRNYPLLCNYASLRSCLAKKSRLACWLVDALDRESLIFRIFLDGARDLGMERQCFGDFILIDVRQVSSGKITQLPISDVETIIGGQKLVNRRKAPHELVDGKTDWAKSQK